MIPVLPLLLAGGALLLLKGSGPKAPAQPGRPADRAPHRRRTVADGRPEGISEAAWDAARAAYRPPDRPRVIPNIDRKSSNVSMSGGAYKAMPAWAKDHFRRARWSSPTAAFVAREADLGIAPRWYVKRRLSANRVVMGLTDGSMALIDPPNRIVDRTWEPRPQRREGPTPT